MLKYFVRSRLLDQRLYLASVRPMSSDEGASRDGVLLNRRDAEFVYRLASSPQQNIKADDMVRAISIFHDISPRPGDKNIGPNLQFLQLLRIFMTYTGWQVPKAAENKNTSPKMALVKKDDKNAAVMIFTDQDAFRSLSHRFPKAQLYPLPGSALLNELNRLKKESASLKDVDISLIFNPSVNDAHPRAFSARLFGPFVAVQIEQILKQLFAKIKDPSSQMPPGSLKPFFNLPFYTHFIKSNDQIVMQTQAFAGFGHRYVLHTSPDLALFNRDEFAAQNGVEPVNVQVLPVRLKSMADLVRAKDGVGRGIKILYGWNEKEFGALSVTFDDMDVLLAALDERSDVSLEDSVRLVQGIVGKGQASAADFELKNNTTPTYQPPASGTSLWSRLKGFFRK